MIAGKLCRSGRPAERSKAVGLPGKRGFERLQRLSRPFQFQQQFAELFAGGSGRIDIPFTAG
jgi:hypothetical protein